MRRITKNKDESMPILNVDIGIKDANDLFFSVEMWDDDFDTLQQMLTAKETRSDTDFQVLPLSNGGTITIDLSEVLFVNTMPYDDVDNNTEVGWETFNDGWDFY